MPEAPLHGIRVIELARILAGPWAGQILADLGADVTKIEKPGDGAPHVELKLPTATLPKIHNLGIAGSCDRNSVDPTTLQQDEPCRRLYGARAGDPYGDLREP